MRALLVLGIFAVLFPLVARPAPARAAEAWVEGSLVHISTTNVKVIDDHTGQSLSFLLVPHFDQIYSEDGKTHYEIAALQRNQLIRVYYDEKFLGARHADRVLVLKRH